MESAFILTRHGRNAINHLTTLMCFYAICLNKSRLFLPTDILLSTFEDFFIEEDAMRTEVGTFIGVEKDILLNATGIYSVPDMSIKLSISIDRIQEIFESLNNRCLVYMADW